MKGTANRFSVAALVVGCALMTEARPAVDESPDRVRYRVKPAVALKFPGVQDWRWLPRPTDGRTSRLVGTLRPRRT